MKKVLVLLLGLVMLVLSGCSFTPPASSFLSTLPWTPEATSTAVGEEISEYKITRYAGDTEGAVISTSNSRVIYTLKAGYSFQIDGDSVVEVADNNSTLLKMDFALNYLDNDDVHELYRAKSEVITSYCAFNRFDLSPKLSYRNAQTSEAAHILVVDYVAKKATLTENGIKSDLSIKSSGYDNEMLYYLVRSLNTIVEGGSATLPLTLAYDDFKYENKNIKSKEIIQTTAEDLVDVAVDASIYHKFFSGSGENKLSCYQTSVGLNTQKSGTPTKLYYASVGTRVASVDINSVSYEAKNVLVKIETELYGYLSGSLSLDYTQVYTLSKYTNK